MKRHELLLYGANGYTGKLIAHMAHGYGIKPILAGRRAAAIEPMAKALNMPYRTFDLHETGKMQDSLSEVQAVLNTAGPFAFTAMPLIEACLATGTHYVDITGEIDVFEKAMQCDSRAKEAGILLLPGAGFDVVPTDCLAAFLKRHLPNANRLKIAFTTLHGALSHGTATTMARHPGEGGAARINGRIVQVPVAHKAMLVDFGEIKRWAMTVPWGDISTAFHTTGIPNIETYTGVSLMTYRVLRFQFLFNWLLRTGFIRNLVKRQIDRRPAGPSPEKRQKSKSLVWGEVSNLAGRSVAARLSGPDGYTMTAHTSLLILKKLLTGEYKPGYHTPAGMYGQDLVMEVPGVQRELIDKK